MCRRISAGLGSSGRLATVSEKCIHSVAWPSTKPQALGSKLDKLLAVGYCGTMKNRKDTMKAKETIELCRKNLHIINHHIVDLSPAMKLFESALTSDDQEIPTGHYEEEKMKFQ